MSYKIYLDYGETDQCEQSCIVQEADNYYVTGSLMLIQHYLNSVFRFKTMKKISHKEILLTGVIDSNDQEWHDAYLKHRDKRGSDD